MVKGEFEIENLVPWRVYVYEEHFELLGLVVEQVENISAVGEESVFEGILVVKLVVELSAGRDAERVGSENEVVAWQGTVGVEIYRDQDVGSASRMVSLMQRELPHTESSCAAERNSGEEYAEEVKGRGS